ncbi:ATP-grasp domain-containing protein (plasmid) [Pseudoalteromonas sp. T1lg65]|uniref:ATP-grasp domain-containing protein n=1 Tax=Pseudoalteromonas sp. T1lg65 TaxID=2077101 RepID=UPI003F7A4100
MTTKKTLPKIGLLYLDYVLRFFDKSNFKGWPDKIETVTYHWGNDKERFIKEVKRKKIDVLIGNIPATAYETFREIARALPEVRFLPSLDSQFSNKSKENVTHFCRKYDLPTPHTEIFYIPEKAQQYLAKASYPKIIKRSYGPSNYGGYFVHKVDSYTEAKQLLTEKRYYPVYVQEFVPMQADIRVMLVGHKPVCAFWRRPPEGEWLTNTSQGGSMDYQDVPKSVLDLAAKASKAANAEYWACDIALGVDGKLRILECATAFAAFPYIRDWIGQYLMWMLGSGRFRKPNIPLYNWEELGKINSNLLRTMRHISFSSYTPSQDSGELFTGLDENNYPIMDVKYDPSEEWPSEVWNFQDNYTLQATNIKAKQYAPLPGSDENNSELNSYAPSEFDEQQLRAILSEVKGIGDKMIDELLSSFGAPGVVEALNNDPERLCSVRNLKSRKLERILSHWQHVMSHNNYPTPA